MQTIDQNTTVTQAGVITVLDENFNARRVDLDDPKVTGQQIAQAAGFASPDNVIVLHQLGTTALAEIRPEESVDLRGPGAERFFVIPGDRTFRFILNDVKMEWPRAEVAGRTLRLLAGMDVEYEVVQALVDQADQIVAESDLVNLGSTGTEHFKTVRSCHLVTVYFGGDDTPFQVVQGTYTTEKLNTLFSVGPGYVLDLIKDDGEFRELKPHESIRLKEGMHFVSHPPYGQSS